MHSYKLAEKPDGTFDILRSDSAVVPQDPDNRDFRDFQAWTASGGVAERVPYVAPPEVLASAPATAFPEGLQELMLEMADRIRRQESEMAKMRRELDAVGSVNLNDLMRKSA